MAMGSSIRVLRRGRSRSAGVVNGRLRQIDVIGRPAPGADRPASHRSRSQHPFLQGVEHSAEALPLRGSAVQDARHVAISASDDGGAYRRSSGLLCSANTRLDGSWTIQLAQGGAGRVHGDGARSRLGPDVAAALGHDPPPHPFHTHDFLKSTAAIVTAPSRPRIQYLNRTPAGALPALLPPTAPAARSTGRSAGPGPGRRGGAARRSGRMPQLLSALRLRRCHTVTKCALAG